MCEDVIKMSLPDVEFSNSRVYKTAVGLIQGNGSF